MNQHEDINKLIHLKTILEKSLSPISAQDYQPNYGDLTDLNVEGIILNSVGKPLLTEIVFEYFWL